MNRRTFEIIAKWIGNETKTTITFDSSVPGPVVNMKTKQIILPDISSHHAIAGLCDVMHEAGHLRYSKKIPKVLMESTEERKNILNCLEDIRIDLKIMKKLPNIKMFYEVSNTHAPRDKTNVRQKTLIDAICLLESLPQIFGNDRDTIDFKNKINFHALINLCSEGVKHIEKGEWTALENCITGILIRLQTPTSEEEKKKPKPQPQPQPNEPQAQGDQQNNTNSPTLQPQPDGPQDSPDPQQKPQTNDAPQDPQEKQEPLYVKTRGKNGKHWGKGALEGGKGAFLDSESCDENIKRSLAEALKISEITYTDDGCNLNTENLTSFMTGDIEGLFFDEQEMKVKKSLVLLLIDASGSMGEPMSVEKTELREVIVKKSVKKLISALKETQETEGLNIEYWVRFFKVDYFHPRKDNWELDYSPSGGTHLTNGIRGALDEIQKHEFDGKKIIICLTDGEVSPLDIERCEREIINHADDNLRLVFIGVDVGINSGTEKIIGSNIIITGGMADEVINRALINCLC